MVENWAQCVLETPRIVPQSYPNEGVRKLVYLSSGSCMVVQGFLQGALIPGHSSQPCTQQAHSRISGSPRRGSLCEKNSAVL